MIIEEIRAIAKEMFHGAPGSHDWEHTLRVSRLCEKIGTAEGADMEVLLCAAYLHDIGRCRQDKSNNSICHAREGAAMAAKILEPFSIEINRKQNIIHAIRSHRYRDNTRPETIEAKVLFDADKLDAIGAVGIARAYLFAGELGAVMHNSEIDVTQEEMYSQNDTGYREFLVKLRYIREGMLTREGRRRAEDRHDFMAAFFDRFLEEYRGLR